MLYVVLHVPYTMWLPVSKLMEESAIIGLPSHYNIGPSLLMYQIKKICLKASALHEQHFVPYVMVWLCSVYTE